jgi:SPX domain protein involved in polyphosphate accumulation
VTPVLSQYYDSPNLTFYTEKLDGIHYRNKVRLRTYGYRFQPGQASFLEIKCKVWNCILKTRQKISGFQESDMDPANWRFDSEENQSAFLHLLERYRLRPSAQIFYLREAYQGVVEADVRVTFDSLLTALFPGEQLTGDVLLGASRRLISDSLTILEVKATNGIPRWVTDGALAVELFQTPVPKYVMGVEKLRLDQYIPIGVYK